MASLCQVESEGVSVLVAQSPHLPAGVGAEGNGCKFLKGNFSVNIDRPGGQGAALVHLATLDGDMVIAVLRHFKIPFDPFARMRPGIAADIIENGIGDGIRIRQGRTPVVACVKARSAAQLCGLPLDLEAVVLRLLAHRGFRLRSRVFRIGHFLRGRRQRDPAEDHRFVHRFQGQCVLALVKIKGIRLRLVSQAVHTPGALLLKAFHLSGADIVALVILPDIPAVGPQTRKTQRGSAGERNFPVDGQLALDIDPAALHSQVIQADIIKSCLRNIHLPCQLGFVGGHHAVVAGAAAFTFKRGQFHRHLFGHSGITFMLRQICPVGVASSDACDIRGQIRAFILLPEVSRTAAQQHQTGDGQCCRNNPDENIPPFPRHEFISQSQRLPLYDAVC